MQPAAVPGSAGSPGRRPGAAKSSKPHERVVRILNEETGKLLTGTLVEVPSVKQAVILCHGFASHRNGFHFVSIAQHLAQKKLSSLRFDFSGNGDSEGTFEFGNYAVEAKDIRAAVQFLTRSGYTVVGLVGHSKGAGSALLYASIYDDIPNVVNVAGRFDMAAGIAERFGAGIHAKLARDKQVDLEVTRDDGTLVEWTLTKWSLQDRLDLDMKQVAGRIRLAEVLTVHGSEDRVIPVADAREWAEHISTHKLLVIEGADHGFKAPQHAEQLIQAIVNHCV